MKPFSYPKNLLLLALALGLALCGPMWAQEPPPAPPPPAEVETPTPPPAPPPVPAADVANEQTEKAETVTAPDAEEDEMRVLAGDEAKAVESSATVEEAATSPETETKTGKSAHRRHGNERVSFGSDSVLDAGNSAEAVISILGSSTSAGEVHDAVVSVLGSSRVTGGSVGDSVVSVLGNTYVNAPVKGEVVAVLGNVELGPDAVVQGEVVCIGGVITRDPKALVKGNVQSVAVAGRNFDFSSLTTWFTECLLYGRPLAFHRNLFWVWTIALALLGFYALIALIAPAGVNKCIDTLERRPGSCLLAALLTLLLTPVAYILLALTLAIVLGFLLIPVFSLGLFCAALFGKIVMLAWIGRRFTKLLGDGPLAHPFFGVLIGGLIVLGLYTVPVLGFITYKLIGILGLGVVVYTLISNMNEGRPPKPAAAVAGVAAQPTTPAAAFVSPPAVGEAASAETSGIQAPSLPIAALPPVISAETLPRAGFWIRVGAASLDFLMVFVCSLILFNGILGFDGGPGLNFLAWIVYHPIMWKLKGTTIGGIICSLKVVRIDDRPIDWGVAIVRALTAFLSGFSAGLGFIWVAFDDEKQSWHDKVAGTTIVRVPKGISLI